MTPQERELVRVKDEALATIAVTLNSWEHNQISDEELLRVCYAEIKKAKGE